MTFPSQSPQVVYEELLERKRKAGGVEYLEFDNEEYRTLLRLGKRIVRKELSSKKHRLLFLALAIAHVRRYNLTTESGFWDKFEDALGRDDKYGFITEELLWRGFKEEGIEREHGEQYRLFVKTLIRVALDDSRLYRDELLGFFEWFYETRPGEEVDKGLVQEYEEQQGTDLKIHESSLQALQRHCHVLQKVLDFAIEEELFLQEVDQKTYREQVQEELGEEYDFDRYRLLSDFGALKKLIIDLENHRTPHQFRQELKDLPGSRTVRFPNGRERRIRGVRKSKDPLPYGSYFVNHEEYRVVPFPWIRLESIRNWKEKQVISLRRSRYVGYRKDTAPFLVREGRKELQSRPCYLSRNEKIHIWAGRIQRGKPLEIDGNPVEGAVGASWSIDLQIGRHEDDWVLRLILSRLDVYYPDHPGKEIKIVSGSQEQPYTLDGRGMRSLRRATSFVVNPEGAEETVQLVLDGNVVETKLKSLAHTYLFSKLSFSRIPEGTDRKWGEQRYLLLTKQPEALNIGEGVEVERSESSFGPYSIIDVQWDRTSCPFFLSVGERTWIFEQSRYFTVQSQLSRGESKYIHLRSHQTYSLDSTTLSIHTNYPLDEVDIRCEVAIGEEGNVLGDFLLQRKDQISYKTLRHLEQKRKDRIGRIDFYFYHGDHLVATEELCVVPDVRLSNTASVRSLHRLGEPFDVNIGADGEVLWYPEKESPAKELPLRCVPRVKKQVSEAFPEGIQARVPDTIEKRIYLPRIDEAVFLQFKPEIFGIWLFEQSGNEYRLTNKLNYLRLADSALLVHSVPSTRVRLLAGTGESYVQICDRETDERGLLLIEDLSFLSPNCEEEKTQFHLESEGKQESFSVRWAPRLHDIKASRGTVQLKVSSPRDTSIAIEWLDSSGNCIETETLESYGAHFEEKVTSNAEASEIAVRFSNSEGDSWTARRARMERDPLLHSITTRGLAEGIGVSDYEVLASLGREGR